MGCCLLELIFLPFELLFEFIFESWFNLMLWIVPDKNISESKRIILKIIVGTLSAVLITVFILGMLGAAITEATVMDLWTLTVLPGGIMLVQIILGIIVRIISKRNRHEVQNS